MAGKGLIKPVSRLPPGKRMAEILAAARVVIAERGYEATSMLAIAEHAGVVEGTLYRFFKTKEELMLRVAEEWLEELLEEDFGLSSIRGTWNRLRHLIWRALHLMRSPTRGQPFRPDRDATDSYLPLDQSVQADPPFHSGCTRGMRGGNSVGRIPERCSTLFVERHDFRLHRASNLVVPETQEGDFRIDEVADSIAHVIYRGMAAGPAIEDDRMERAVKRLEKAAAELERRSQDG